MAVKLVYLAVTRIIDDAGTNYSIDEFEQLINTDFQSLVIKFNKNGTGLRIEDREDNYNFEREIINGKLRIFDN